MSERKHEQKVKDVRIDDDNLCIELLNGLRLVAPMRTRPIARPPEPQDMRAPVEQFLPAMTL